MSGLLSRLGWAADNAPAMVGDADGADVVASVWQQQFMWVTRR